MLKIRLPRRAGKTIKAMHLANAMDAYLVVHNKQEAHRVFYEYKNDQYYPKLKLFPITYDELLDRKTAPDLKIVIDNIELFRDTVLRKATAGLRIQGWTENLESRENDERGNEYVSEKATFDSDITSPNGMRGGKTPKWE